MTSPSFAKHFDRYACDGDSIETECGAIRLVATLYRDDDATPPDERGDGYWPSLDPNSPGYIGPKSAATLARHTRRAQDVLEAWRDDEWWYVGVAVRAFIGETPLTGEFDHALWGIECNYPTRRKRDHPNAYLRDVANQYAGEAYDAALERLEELADAAESVRPDMALAALKRLLAVFDSRDVPARIIARQAAESVVAELESGK